MSKLFVAFPFLKQILPEDTKVDSVELREFTENMFMVLAHDTSHVGSLGMTLSWYMISFVLRDGTFLRHAVKPRENYSSNFANDVGCFIEGETITDALQRLCLSREDIEYIVVEDFYFYDWPGRYTRWDRIIIYIV